MPKTSEARLRAQKKFDAANRPAHYTRRQRYRERNRAYVADSKAGKTCLDCGCEGELDYHHVRFPKVGEVANMANNTVSIARLQAEIDKCVLLCRSCHATRHATIES